MFTTDIQAARGTSLLDFPAPAGSVVSGAFDDALETNPVPLFMQSMDLADAKARGTRLPRDQALDQAKRAGVSLTVPEEGMTQPALAILIERKRDEAAKQLLMARSPGGLATAGTFGAGLAGAMLDPLNVASGFVPVLGGTRYAAMLGEAGTAGARAGIRLGLGAAEGAVGSAMVELPTSVLRRDLQDDYSLYDSLTNMAFGTFASAGIRGVSGAARDAWLGLAKARELDALRAVDPKVWESARATAANAQERAFWTDLEQGFQRGDGIPDSLRESMARDRFDAESHVAGAEFAGAMREESDARTQRLAEITQAADAAIERRFQREREKMLAAGVEPDEALKQAFAKAYPETERRLKSAAEIGADRLDQFALDDARKAILEGRGLIQVPTTNAQILAAISDETHAHSLKAAVAQAIEGQRVDVTPVLRQDKAFGAQRFDLSETRAWAKRQDSPEAKVGADRGASERAAEDLKKSETKPAEPKAEPKTNEPPKSPERVEAEALLDQARDFFESVVGPRGPMDERLATDAGLRRELAAMKEEAGWAEIGGHMIREHVPGQDFQAGRVTGFTEWIPKADWWPGRPAKARLNKHETAALIDKALAGEPLKNKERKALEYMLEIADARARSENFLATKEELIAEGLGKGDSFDGALTARAASIDEAKVEALSVQFADDDAAFMRGVKEILDAEDARAKTGEPREASEPAPGEGASAEAQSEKSPEVARAEQYADAWKAIGDCAVGGGL